MCVAAQLAEAGSGFLEIEASEGICVGAIGADSEPVDEGPADQMRRLALHFANPEVDARLPKINRQQLRMRIGRVQDARIAEPLELVDAGGIGGTRDAWNGARERGCAREFKKIPAADSHHRIS